MAKTKRRLTLGMPFTGIETEHMSLSVHPGRWIDCVGGIESECVVVVQERRKGPLGPCSVFKMAVDPEAAQTVWDGLGRWIQAASLGTLGRLFGESNGVE